MNVDAERALAEAAEAGIDLDLIDANLRLSVAERWRQHDAALNLVLRLEQAKRTRDRRSDGVTPTDH